MKTVVISKEFSWAMGHRLTAQFLPEGIFSKCRMLHGHNYKMQILLGFTEEAKDSEIVQNFFSHVGMVYDFTLLKPVKDFIDNFLDHRFMVPHDDLLVEILTEASYRFIPLDEFKYEGFTKAFTFTKFDRKPINEAIMWRFTHELIDKTLSSPPAKLTYGNVDFAEKEVKTAQFLEIIGGLLLTTFEPTAENMAVVFAKVIENLVNEVALDLLNSYATKVLGDPSYNDVSLPVLRVESVRLFETDKSVAQFLNTDEIDALVQELTAEV